MSASSDEPAAGEPGRRAMRAGVIAMLPILIGIIPFAAVAGLAGTHNGFTVFETAAFSLLAFAGAAQVAALDLIGNGAGAGVVIATALIINVRFIVYSATLAPMFADASLRRRTVGSYLLVDHAVPLTLTRTEDWPRRDKVAFYTGACLIFWLTWQICSFVGSFFGSLPNTGVVAFAVPISFLALLAPQLRDRPKLFAAIVGAAVAVVGADLPANLGMMLGTFAGIATGVAFGWRAAGQQAA
ncbi:branched-chain amino acid ABC transporter permease [Mycobacterium sp. PS03-16]|uniref:AzlC family ABC transporter permease n=1 Tax=Mycobacterium sp. PS03-16 TaxID=2559611 RepID=UPI001073F4C5|nr:AzlC family ABC transporter permease [Mycobacterium sp. PS03-16]TFV54620.1 branched-chain amino acid ABC transporter permease [Mycobacterium sp. PS03-16]